MTDHYDVIIVGSGALWPQDFGALEHIGGVGP